MTINPTVKETQVQKVTDAHLGGNALWHRDDVDDPQFTGNMDIFNIRTIRWPGGSISEQRFDPANPDAPLDTPRIMHPDQAYMKMDTDEALTFTEAAQWCHDTGRGMSVVLPVRAAIECLYDEAGNYAGYKLNQEGLDDITNFVKEALTKGGKYADFRLDALEIGNEYWGGLLTSKDYGNVADKVIKAAMAGVKASGTDQNPRILVQEGASWACEFKEGGQRANEGLSWEEKVLTANRDVIAGLSQESRDIIDGTVDHWYLDMKGEFNYGRTHDKVAKLWAEAGMDVPVNYTEWNTRDLQNGQSPAIKTGMLIEMFEHMVRQGAESTYIWPVNQSTNNDLAGKFGSGPGHLSFNGAGFQLLSQNVRGMEWEELSIEKQDGLESSFYHKKGEMVLFLTNNTDKAIKDSVELANLLAASGISSDNAELTLSEVVRDPTQDKFVGKDHGAKIETTTSDLKESEAGINLEPWQTVMIKIKAGPQEPPEPETPEDPENPSHPDVPDGPDDGEEETEQNDDGSGGGCFVATAAYGHRMHPDVVALRRFRDNHLVRSALGRRFIRAYWVVGPVMASHISRESALSSVIRTGLSAFVRLLRKRDLTAGK